ISSYQPLDEELDVATRTRGNRPCIGARGQFLERACGRARRIRFQNGALLPHRAAKVLVFRDFACELQHYIEETCGYTLKTAEQFRARAGHAHLVGEHAEALYAVIATQHLDESISV